MPGKLVITRPKADAEKLAKSLKQKGYDSIIEPILIIKTLHEESKKLETLLENKPQSIIATSKHAISAFAALNPLRSIPLITVGHVTAAHAKKLGFNNVKFASGNAISIVSYIMANNSASNGGLLYIRGQEITTDIATKLIDANYKVDSVVLYRAEKARKLSDTFLEAIKNNEIDSVAFYSQNTAITYVKLASEHSIAKIHSTITALCLSQEIADTIKTLLPWKQVSLFPAYLADTD